MTKNSATIFRAWALLFLIGLSVSLLGQTNLQQPLAHRHATPGVHDRLELGKVTRVELADGQSHSYVLTIQAGQFVRVVVSQQERVFVLRLLSMDGSATFLDLDLRGLLARREVVCWIAGASGQYRLELSVPGKTAAAQVADIEPTELRAALPQDDKRLFAQELLNQASRMMMQRRPEEAVGILQQALALSRETKDREQEATELSSIGFGYLLLGQHDKAISFSEQALAIWRETKNHKDEGDVLATLGTAYIFLRQYETAIGYLEQGLAVKRATKDREREIGALEQLANAYSGMNQYEKEVSLLEQSLAIQSEIKDRHAEGRDLASLGTAYSSLNQYEKAIALFEQALAVNRELKDRLFEGISLYGLGEVYNQLGQSERAIVYYEQALAVYREVEDRHGESTSLVGLGDVYLRLHQNERAIGYYEQALAVDTVIYDRHDEAYTLRRLGIAYAGMPNQTDKAIDFLNQALAVNREIKDRQGESYSLLELGKVYTMLSQYERAIDDLEHALVVSREVEERPSYDAVQGSFGGSSGRSKREVEYAELGPREVTGDTLQRLGVAYDLLGKYQEAVNNQEQALAVYTNIKDRVGETWSLALLAAHWAKSGRVSLAIFYGKLAVNTNQSIRADNRGLDRDVQESFLRTNESPYHLLADLLITQGRLAEAEQVLNLLKEEEYFEFVRRDKTEASLPNRYSDLTADEQEWEKRYREIGDKLVALGMERGELLAKPELTAEERQRLAQVEKDLAIGNSAFEKFLGELAEHFSTSTGASAKIEQLRETQGIMEDLRDLPEGTVAIYTLVGEDKVWMILVTPDVQKAYEYPIKAADLNRKVLEFRRVLQNPKLDPRPLGQGLYKILVANMAEDLRQAKAKTVMWSLDGGLRYLPVAALYDGESYLIEQYALSVFTPASNARLKDRPDQEWKAAGFGVTRAYEGAPALPEVAAELSGIIEQKTGQGGIMAGEIKLDDQFTEDAMRQTLLKRSNITRWCILRVISGFTQGTRPILFCYWGTGII